MVKPDGTRERIVRVDSATYRSVIRKEGQGEVLEIFDETGGKKAAVLLNEKDKYDVLLADSTQLKWSGISDDKWSYSLAGKAVTSGAIQKVQGRKRLVVTIHDPAYPAEVLQLITLDRGAPEVITKSTAPMLIALSVAVALMQVVANN